MATDIPLDRMCPTCLMIRGQIHRLSYVGATGHSHCSNPACAAQFTDSYLRQTLGTVDRLVQALGFAPQLVRQEQRIESLERQLERARELPNRPPVPRVKLKRKPKPRPRRVSLEDGE